MDICMVVNVLNGVKDVSNLFRITYQETPGLLWTVSISVVPAYS